MTQLALNLIHYTLAILEMWTLQIIDTHALNTPFCVCMKRKRPIQQRKIIIFSSFAKLVTSLQDKLR